MVAEKDLRPSNDMKAAVAGGARHTGIVPEESVWKMRFLLKLSCIMSPARRRSRAVRLRLIRRDSDSAELVTAARGADSQVDPGQCFVESDPVLRLVLLGFVSRVRGLIRW